jgi:Spy/CpxP family protein refolding chaperone
MDINRRERRRTSSCDANQASEPSWYCYARMEQNPRWELWRCFSGTFSLPVRNSLRQLKHAHQGEWIMGIYSKTAFAVLALALSCSPLLAQDGPQDSPAHHQGARDGFGSHRGSMASGENQGRWGHRHGGFGRDGRRGGRHSGFAHLLNDPSIRQQVGITDEQAATIRKQELDFRKTEIRGRADLEVRRVDLNALLAADKPDRAAINAKLQEISAAQLSLQKSSIDYRLSMRDAITPAQREKLRQLMRDRRQRGGGPGRAGRQGGGRRGPGGAGPAPDSQGKPQTND